MGTGKSLRLEVNRTTTRRFSMFVTGHLYQRSEIHRRYGGQEQGGISTPADHQLVLLFTGESGKSYGYRDGWQSDGSFHYTGEGQVGDMKFKGGNIAIRDHVKNGEDLHLFQIEKDGVRYVGQMLYAGHELVPNVPDRDKHPRTVLMFRLLPLESISDMRESVTGGISSSGQEIPESWYWREPLGSVRAAALEQPLQSRDPIRTDRNVYHRSEAVRVYVLRRSNGLCEGCGSPAPFRTKDKRPYLEPHHIRRISDGGPDLPTWVVALCPTCHRRAHYAEDAEKYNEFLKAQARTLEKGAAYG